MRPDAGPATIAVIHPTSTRPLPERVGDRSPPTHRPLMSMHATARRLGDGLRREVLVNGRHVVITDEPVRLGGTDSGPAPHELLPAALASCIATMIALYAANRGWDLGDVPVAVHYDNEATPRRFDVEIRLPAGLSDDQVTRLRRVADTCPVRRALEAGFTFDERIVLAAEPAARDVAA